VHFILLLLTIKAAQSYWMTKDFNDGKLLKMSYQSFDDNEVIDVIDCEDGEHIIIAGNNTKVRLPVLKRNMSNTINLFNLAYQHQ